MAPWAVVRATPVSGWVTATTVGAADGAYVGAPGTGAATGAPEAAVDVGPGVGGADGNATGKLPPDAAGLTVCTLMTPFVVTIVYEMQPAVAHVVASVTGVSVPSVTVYPASCVMVDGVYVA